MANVFIEESTMQAIGDAVRAKTGKSDGILPSDMPAEIESIETGSGGGGNDVYYDAFWDTFQGAENGGEPISYYYAFFNNRFDDETYNPKHDIVCSDRFDSAWYMFNNNTKITSTKVPIDVTRTAEVRYMFGCYNPPERSKLETIVELKVSENNTFTSAFNLLYALKNITITGTIGNDISFKWSPLTKASILSVYGALSTTVTGKTITFKQTAVNAAFETSTGANDGSASPEWEALKAEHSNWTIALA